LLQDATPKKSEVKLVEKEEEKQSDTQRAGVGESLGDPADDRTLRAAMYGVLFQTYADKVSAGLRQLSPSCCWAKCRY